MTLAFFRDTDQRILADSLRRAFAGALGDSDRATPAARDAARRVVAEQQPILPIAGDGLSLVDAAAIAEEAGRARLPFPLREALVAATALTAAGDAIPPALARGEVTAALGEARVTGARFTATAPGAASAGLLVLLRDGESRLVRDPAGRFDIAAPEGFDVTAAPARVSGEIAALGNAVGTDLRPIAYVLAAADILGAASDLFDRAVAYLGTRSQFGQPLSSYQALRHRAADDWVALEDIRAAVDWAAALHDGGAPAAEVLRAARIAKATASAAGPRLAENAIQYHGAAGFTWDLGLHVGLRRIRQTSLLLGTANDHYARLGAALAPAGCPQT